MAKAVAQAQGGKAAGRAKGGKAAGQAKGGKAQAKRGKARGRGPGTWAKIAALVILFPFAAVLLPTTLVFFVMMAPTWVAYITDRSRDKNLAITVGMLNFAGTLPAIIDLWTRGQSHPTAMLLIGDVFVWIAAYGAAFAGWGIFAVMPTVVGSFYRMTTDGRIKGLVKQQKALIAEWGHAVADGSAAAVPGDEDSEAEEEDAAEEDAEVTEAELVQPRRAR
jgi:hypothetical protein